MCVVMGDVTGVVMSMCFSMFGCMFVSTGRMCFSRLCNGVWW